MSKKSIVHLRPEDVRVNLELLSQYGVRCEHWNILRQPGREKELRRVVNALKGWKHADSIPYQAASGIMKPTQFFGPAQWRNFFGVVFSKEQRRQFEEFPWSAEVLQHRYSDDKYESGEFMHRMDHEYYFAFLAPDRWIDGDPLTILKWYEILQQRIENGAPGPLLDPEHSRYQSLFGLPDKFPKEEVLEASRQFLTETTPTFGWYLMRVEDQEGLWRREDQYNCTELLLPNHRTATAIERILMHSCYYLLNGTYLKQDGDDYHGGVCADEPRRPGMSGNSLLPHPQVKCRSKCIHLGEDSYFSQHQDTRHYPVTRIPGH
ncbi:MAG: hypothetical protein KBB55_00750 [Candidatus Buchananbacteria bacterium]|nr:hypothetical protein [Candidatus Buchananbacteria bacterium]